MGSKKGFMSWYFNSNLLARIMIGLIGGAVLGIVIQKTSIDLHAGVASGFYALLGALGDLFIRLLKMIVQPVIIFTLVVGTSTIAPSRLGRVGIKTVIYYIITSIFAIVIGLGVAMIFKPGVGLELAADGVSAARQAPSLLKTLLAIVPTNPFEAIAKGDVLPTIFFSIFFGLGLAYCRDSKEARVKNAADTVYNCFEGAAEVTYKIVRWVMQVAPVGVFSLIFIVFVDQGAKVAGSLLHVTIVVYLGLLLQLAITYGGASMLFGFSPLRMFKKIRLPMVTAFVTRSSGGTLPISMETAELDMGVKRSVFGFTLPLGATVNMDGTTIYLGVCTMFIANAVGLPLDFSQMTVVVITCILASIGTAGVPGAGAIMLIMVLQSVGLGIDTNPLVAAAYAMILGIDAILDMGRTGMNVTGDMVGTAIVAKLEGEMDMDVWNADRAKTVE